MPGDGDDAWMAQQLALLPPDLRKLVSSMPKDKAKEVLQKLIQQTELDFRQLREEDVAIIKARTDQQSQFGFLPVDVGFTWDDINQEQYIALGAFDVQQDAGNGQSGEVPVAFVIAEMARMDHTLAFLASEMEQGQASAVPPQEEASEPAGNSTASNEAQAGQAANAQSSREKQPQQEQQQEQQPQREQQHVRELAEKGDWQDDDLAVSVQYIGVDFEYRRQGIGKQLLDMVKQVAWAAGARMIWLTVATYNTAALSFYQSYGFQAMQQFRRGERGNHCLYVLTNPGAGKKARGGLRRQSSKARQSSGKKGFGRPKACLAAAVYNNSSRSPACCHAAAQHTRLQLHSLPSRVCVGDPGRPATRARCCTGLTLRTHRSSNAVQAVQRPQGHRVVPHYRGV